MAKGKKEIQREEPELNSDEEAYKVEETVKELIKEDEKLLRPKRGRKKAVEPGQVLTIVREEEETVSFNKAKELIKKQKPKYEPSEKQKANTARLIEANRIRREAKQEAKEKADALEEAKLKQKKLIVLPKRARTKKTIVEELPKELEPEESSSEEREAEPVPVPTKTRKQRKQKIAKVYDGETTDGDTTDTRTIKKKIEKVKMIDETIKQSKFNAISKGFF